jgi:hypothetical protein
MDHINQNIIGIKPLRGSIETNDLLLDFFLKETIPSILA